MGMLSNTDKIANNDEAVPSRVWDFRKLLEEMLGTVISLVGANAGFIRLFPPNAQPPQTINSTGLPQEFWVNERTGCLDCGICGNDALYSGIYSSGMGDYKARSERCFFSDQLKAVVSVPLESQGTIKTLIGAITLFFSTPQQATDPNLKTVASFAKLISTSVEYNKVNREHGRADLIAERHSIASEIHDSLAPTLVYARMRTNLLIESIRSHNELTAAKYANDIDEALEISQKTARELITDFRCTLDPSGLLNALQTLAEQFRQRNDISLEYTNRAANPELPLEHEIQAYHIVREALANIATHSGATHARLIVDYTCDSYVITIEDNGSGGSTFTPVEGHYGIMIMRERAQRIGGEIKVESSKGFGTRVQLFFPAPLSGWRAAHE